MMSKIFTTVLSRQYALYFGLTENETSELLEYYGLKLDLKVKRMYDGYQIANVDMYNSWSVPMIEVLRNPQSTYIQFVSALQMLTAVVNKHYSKPPILLIDEYDQPIISSYEYGYHDETVTFFANCYGKALKGNPDLDQALLTGIQRVAKESIFSQLNNQIYTEMVIACTSYMDAKENAYHMLFLGMSMTLRNSYTNVNNLRTYI